jgi:hypothetical protein
MRERWPARRRRWRSRGHLDYVVVLLDVGAAARGAGGGRGGSNGGGCGAGAGKGGRVGGREQRKDLVVVFEAVLLLRDQRHILSRSAKKRD